VNKRTRMSRRLRSASKSEGWLHSLDTDCLSLILRFLFGSHDTPNEHNVRGMQTVWRLALTCHLLEKKVTLLYGEVWVEMRDTLCTEWVCLGILSTRMCLSCDEDMCCTRCGHLCAKNALCNECLLEEKGCDECGHHICAKCQGTASGECDWCEELHCDRCLDYCHGCDESSCGECKYSHRLYYKDCATCDKRYCEMCREDVASDFTCDACDWYFCATCVDGGLTIDHRSHDKAGYRHDLCQECYDERGVGGVEEPSSEASE
jgi:hypothetical protein